MPRYTKTEIAEARAALVELLPPGTTVYTNVEHVSRRGWPRRIRLFVVDKDEIVGITWRVARVLGWRMKDGALIVDGCGMDICFDTVNQLSYALHGREDKKAPACAGSDITRPDNFRAGYSLTKRDL